MVASIFTLDRGLVNYGQVSNVHTPSERKLLHREGASISLGSGLRGFETMSDHGLAVPVESGHALKPILRSHLHATKLEKRHKSLLEGYQRIQDTNDTLRQEEAEIFCIDNYVSMIKESRETKKLISAKIVHLHICGAGLEALETPGNHLVPMFVECGSISCAQQAFNKIASLTEHAWTFLMQGYIAYGEPDLALSAFQTMQEGSPVPPSKFTYVASLKACTKTTNLQRGQALHAEVVTKGIEDDRFIGNMLVDMYAKCFCYMEARETFNKLPVQDVVSWNALLGGYVEGSFNEEALECFDQMYHAGVPFDAITYACILKACRNIGAIDKGREIHAEMATHGFETNEFACSLLVDMYAKHSLFLEARDVFDSLPYHDAVAWTSLVGGYVEGGAAEDALKCLEQMQLEGITPDAVSFSFFLKACGILGELERVLELHNDTVKGGFEHDSYVRNSLITAYFSCGGLEAALDVSDQLPNLDVVSWNVLIAAYTEQGNAKEALYCWEQMRGAQVLPDAVTFISTLKACGMTKVLHFGREIHVKIVEEEFESDSSIANALIDMYAKCGSLIDAREVFEELPFRNVISWTAIIAGYVDNGLCVESLMCLENMQVSGVLPNLVTYLCSLKACCSKGDMHKGQGLHMEIVMRGLDREVDIGNILVDMYANFGLIEEARHVFSQQQLLDVVTWNALISGYAQCGWYEEARSCLQQMQLEGMFPDEVTWNAVLTACAEQGAYENSLNAFKQMQEQGFLPNAVTYLIVLKACSFAGVLEEGRRIHAQIYRMDTFISIISTVLIDMYGKCGSMAAAQDVFDFVLNKDAVTWNALLANYARLGDCKTAFRLYEMMRGASISPDQFTLLNILMGCSHAGLVDKGQLYYEELCGDTGVAATIEHHNGLLDLFARAGQLNEAVAILDLLPVGPNHVSWSTVLGSFRKSVDVEFGKYAFDWILLSDKDDSSAFVLMSSIFGDF